MSKKKPARGVLLMRIGLALLACAFLLTGYNLWDAYRAEQKAAAVFAELSEGMQQAETETIPDYVLFPEMEMPVRKIGERYYIGILEIPTLGLTLPVTEEWSYPNLKTSPCRYAGSAYLDNFVIAAHNYNSHFGKIHNLYPGEQILFTDVDGNQFRYEVRDIEVMQPTEIAEMTSGEYALTLFTCTYDGRSRVALRCEKIN